MFVAFTDMIQSIASKASSFSAALILLHGAANAAPQQAALSDDRTTADIIAVKIRNQGYRCETPQGVKRGKSRSMPRDFVWTLKCANATYRVKLIPDMAAHIERLN